MAFDAFYLSAVLGEMEEKCRQARVEKIFQPSRDTLIFLLRCKEGREKLLFAANPTAPRLHLTAASPENPAEDMPPIVYLHGNSGKEDDLQKILDKGSLPAYL